MANTKVWKWTPTVSARITERQSQPWIDLPWKMDMPKIIYCSSTYCVNTLIRELHNWQFKVKSHKITITTVLHKLQTGSVFQKRQNDTD